MKVLKVIKKAVKWYLRKSSETDLWTPSGMVPPLNL